MIEIWDCWHARESTVGLVHSRAAVVVTAEHGGNKQRKALIEDRERKPTHTHTFDLGEDGQTETFWVVNGRYFGKPF